VRRCALSFLILCSCARHETTAPVRIAVGGQAQLIYLVATLADTLGFYKEEGLTVTIQDFPGGAKSLEALLGGSTDVVCGFYDHAIQMAAQGKSLRAFVSVLRYPGLVAVSPRVARVEDLKGKIVGVSAAGSSTQMFLNYLLARHGMKADDVSVASIGMSATAVAAITHAKVDAAIMTDPALEIVRQQMPALKILADTRTAEGVREVFGVDQYPSVVFYSTPAWIDAHREETRKTAQAALRAMEWLRSHTPEEIRARMPAQFRTGNDAADLEGVRSLQAMLSADGKMSLDGAEAVRKVLAVSLPSLREANLGLAGTFTNEFVP